MKFKKGDWIARVEVSQPLFGIVKEFYDDPEPLVDIIAYAVDGTRIGRVSPAEGGPTTFEPCCPANGFARIEKPKFPLKLSKWSGDWSQLLVFLYP